MSVYNGLIKVEGRGTVPAGRVPESLRSMVNQAIENFPDEDWSVEIRDAAAGTGELTERDLAEYFDKEYTVDAWIHSVMFIDTMEELAENFEYGNVETFSFGHDCCLIIGIQDPELSVPESDRILDELEADPSRYDSVGEELLRRLPASGWEYYTPDEVRELANRPHPQEA